MKKSWFFPIPDFKELKTEDQFSNLPFKRVERVGGGLNISRKCKRNIKVPGDMVE